MQEAGAADNKNTILQVVLARMTYNYETNTITASSTISLKHKVMVGNINAVKIA